MPPVSVISRMSGVKIPSAAAEAEGLIGAGACAVNFCAVWAEPCAHLNTVFAELAKEYSQLTFVQLDVDDFPEQCEKFSLESVPAFLFLRGGALVDSVMGVDVPALVNKVKQHNLSAEVAQTDGDEKTQHRDAAAPPVPLDERLRTLTHLAPVMLFMKGTADEPRCGFSRKAVALLRDEKVTFSTFDILGDEEVRQGLKTFSNWPTYPQLYADGKLLGGLDIMKELQEEGELASSLPASAGALA